MVLQADRPLYATLSCIPIFTIRKEIPQLFASLQHIDCKPFQHPYKAHSRLWLNSMGFFTLHVTPWAGKPSGRFSITKRCESNHQSIGNHQSVLSEPAWRKASMSQGLFSLLTLLAFWSVIPNWLHLKGRDLLPYLLYLPFDATHLLDPETRFRMTEGPTAVSEYRPTKR